HCFCLLLLASLPFAVSARAMTTADGSSTPTESREHAKAFGVDGLDCITEDDADEEPLQVVVADRSAGWPNPTDNGPSVSVDRATLPTRTNKKPLHFAETRFEL